MKKHGNINLITLIVLFACCVSASTFAASATVFYGDIITRGPWVDARAFSNLSSAVNSSATASKTILIATPLAISDDLTIPTDRALRVIKGGSLDVAAGKTLTINGPFEAGPYRIFTGSGAIVFGSASYVVRHDEWFGTQKDNTTIGHGALVSNTTGTYNIAIGKSALANNTIENYAVAIGTEALNAYTGDSGGEATAVGSVALKRLTTGKSNACFGSDCMPYTTTGSYSLGAGQAAGFGNTTGSYNTFVGAYSGKDNTTGMYNSYLGYDAGIMNYATTGSYNTYLGAESGPYQTGASAGSPETQIHHATTVGYYAKAKVSNSVILGSSVEDHLPTVVGIGTSEPKTQLEIFGQQGILHSTAKTARGLLAIYDSYGSDYPNAATPAANTGGGITFGGFINGTELSGWGAIKCNKSNATADDGSGYCDVYTAAADATMTAKFRVYSNGDVELLTTGSGLIMTSPDGQRRRKITLSNSSDAFVFSSL